MWLLCWQHIYTGMSILKRHRQGPAQQEGGCLVCLPVISLSQRYTLLRGKGREGWPTYTPMTCTTWLVDGSTVMCSAAGGAVVEAGSAVWSNQAPWERNLSHHMPGHARPPLHPHPSHAGMLLWLEVATYTMHAYLYSPLTSPNKRITSPHVAYYASLSISGCMCISWEIDYCTIASLVTEIGNQHSEVYNDISQMNISTSRKLQEIWTHTNLRNARLDNVIDLVN